MALGADGTDGAEKVGHGRDNQEAKTDERGCLQAARGKVCITGLDGLIEADNLLMNLRAHPADQEVSVRRHESEYNSWPILYLPIGLR